MSTKARTGFYSQIFHFLKVKYLLRRKALIISAFLVFIQLATPLTSIAVYAASVTSNDVGSSAALDPVANKANRLQMQGSSGVDQSTGAFTYSYPLSIPEGRGAMSPKLTLSYNSQNNEVGWFGYGWNMSIPYIDRTTKTGTDKLYTSPAFVSSLHGELISSNGTSYEQKIDDGSYVKYTYTGTTWQMTDRDGTTYYFGNTYESRVQNDAGTKIGRWYLNEVRDKFGNGIVYTYTKVEGSVYPNTISYTEHALAHPLNLVTFGLENKVDSSISYKYGFRTLDTKRVLYVKVTTNGKDNSFFNFNYTKGSNGSRSLLQSVEEKHLSTNDDWTVLPKTTFEYENSSTTISGSISNSLNPYGGNSVIDTNNDGVLDLYNAGDGYYAVDINGDYKKDLIFSDMRYNAIPSYNFDLNFSYNIGTGTTNFFLRKMARPYNPYATTIPVAQAPPLRSVIDPATVMVPRSMIVDINGDGFDDIIYNDPYGGNGVAINSTNNTFVYPSTSNLTIDLSSSQIADINGDGLQDKITRSNTATSTIYSVYLNNGESYTTSPDFVYDVRVASTTYDLGVRFIDINNDGLLDVVRSYSSTYTTSGTPLCTGGEVTPSPTPINQSINEFSINTGTNFVLSSSTFSGYLITYTGCHDGWGNPFLLIKSSKEFDTNGDLTTDFDGAVNNSLKQDVLKKVNNSLGSTIDISYTWSTKTGLNPKLPVPMYIVASTTDKLSISDQNPHTVSYNFYDGQMYFDATSPRDHKFAGFGKVDMIDGKNKTTSYYHQGNEDDTSTGEKGDSYYNIGRAYRMDVYDLSSGSSTLISKNLSLYATYSNASSSFTYLDSQITNVYNSDGSYLSSGVKSIYDENKRLIKTTYSYGDIEPFFSFSSSTITDRGSDLVITQYLYSNDRPQRLIKEVSTDFSGKTISTNSYYYDNLPLGLVDKGAVTSIASTIYNPDGSVSATSTTQKAYDPTGNVIQTIDGLNNKAKITYDSSYFFPITKVDALNGTTTLTYDPYTLNLLTLKGSDGITYVKETDGLGKVTRSYTMVSGGGISDEVRTAYVYGGGIAIFGRRLGSTGASSRTLEIYDSYGRLVQSKKETTPDLFSTQDIKYDAQNNVISTSLPYTTNGYGYTQDTPSNGSIVYSYDGLGRVITKSVFGTTYSYQYGARNLTATDNASTQHKKSYFYDASNNLSQVKEYNGASTYTTSYNYTPQNKLSSITDASGNIRNFSYFSNGLLKYQEDPHSSSDTTYTTYSYTYDVLGNLLSKSGPLGTLSYTYDAINRPSTRVVVDGTYGTSTVSFTYTGCSNTYLAPCTINRGTSSTTLTYTTNGKLNSEMLSIDGKTFSRSYTYDIYGNPVTVTYPDNGIVTYTYTLDGKQSTLTYTTPSGVTKNIVTSSTYNSLNSLSSMSYGNGVQMCNTYTTTSNEGTISPKLQKSVYLFNSTGCTSGIANQIELYKDEFTYKDSLTPSNILSTYKDISGTTHTKSDTLTYDNLVRLTGVSTSYDGGGAVTDTLVYDPIGNILQQNDVLFRYSVDGTQNAHAVTSIGGSHVTYDAQGNRIQVGDNTYTWNALNQMLTASSTNGSEIYTYDEQGERIKKIVKAATGISQKATPATGSSSLDSFKQGDILANVATTSMYIATSTYNKLSSVSLLDKATLTTFVGNFYSSPFTSKYCASSASPAIRQSCTASTTKQLIANNLNSRSTTTIATVGLVDDAIRIVTGALLIPSTYTGLATSSIATSSPTTFTIDSPTISSYNTFVATGVVVPMSEYSNLPYVSSSTYTTISSVGLTDTSKVRALLTLSGCTSIVTSCATAKKVVFEKYYKENGYLLSDKALEEMWYVFAAKARLPGNSVEFTATSTTLGSISVPTVTGINASSATTTYYSGLYFNTEYTNQNAAEPRLTYFNIIPYYVTQSAFTELQQAGITQSTLESYQSFIADLLGTKVASSTEYIFALKSFAQYDKKVILSQNTLKELYLVVLGAATIPNSINDYSANAVFDLSSYLSVQTVYGSYGSTLANTTSGCNGGAFSGGFARCVIRVSPFSLPVATSSTISYLLSVTAPSVIEFVLNAGESSNTRAVVDNNNYATQVPTIYSYRYGPATGFGGMLDYISGSISSDGFTQTIDVTTTIVKQKASSTEPSNVLLMNRSGWTGSEQYIYQSSSTVLRAYVSTPHLTLASTSLVAGVTNATSSSFTAAILSTIGAYYGEIYDSSSIIQTGFATSSLVAISPQAYAEFSSTTLRDEYDISRVFLATSTPWCEANASTTECDKQARKTFFKQTITNFSGFTPSDAAVEEFWMVHKGILTLPSIIYTYATSSSSLVTSSSTSYITKNARLIGSYPTTNFGGSITASASDGPRNGFVSFTMPDIPSTGATVSSVKLYLSVGFNYGVTAPVEVHQVTSHTGWTQAGATWNKYDGTNNWTTAGGDYSSIVVSSTTIASSKTGYVPFDIVGGSANNPLTLTWNDQAHVMIKTTVTSAGFDFDSKESPSGKPYVEIVYAPASSSTGPVVNSVIATSSQVFSRSSLPTTLATSTTSTSTTHLELVPPGLLSSLQFNSLYASSTFALSTSTKVISQDTYNELLRTPLRVSSDIDTVFDYAATYASSSCSGQSATSSCYVGAQKSKVKDTISAFSGFVVSEAALEELYKVKNNELSIVPVALTSATMSTTSQTLLIPLSLSDAYTTFSTSTTGTTTLRTSRSGSCSFGTTGATTSACYITMPYLNTSVSSMVLSYVSSTSSLATSTLRSTLTSVSASYPNSSSSLVTSSSTSYITKNARLIGSYPTTNFGGSITASASDGPRNGFVSFTMPDIPSTGATVSSVKLYLSVGFNYGVTAPVEVHQVTSHTGWTQAGATWNKYDGTNNWTTAGGDYSSIVVSSTTIASSKTGYVPFDIVGGSANNPLTLTWNDQAHVMIKTTVTSAGFDFDSKESPSGKPYVEIVYAPASYSVSTSTPTIATSSSVSIFTGTKSSTSTFSYDISSLYQNFLSSPSPTLTLTPDGNATSTTLYSLSTTTLTVTRDVTVPQVTYNTSTSTVVVFSRSSIPSFATTTATTSINLTSLPPLYFSADYISPISRIGVGSTTYAGSTVDPSYVPPPTLPDVVLPAVGYPYATSTMIATGTISLLSQATTTQYTTYTPFSNYVEDSRGVVTTYFTLNGTLVGAYSYQKGNEASTGKITFAHTNYLGTPVIETDDKGDIVQMDITDVFGNYVQRNQRNDNAYHSKSYTGHEFDDVSGNLYAHARYLNSPSHTFLSVDPMLYKIPDSYLNDPQQMNSYAYARNNPIVYTDPDGKFILPLLAAAALVSIVAANVLPVYYALTNAPTPQLQASIGVQQSLTGILGSVPIKGGGAYTGFATPSTGAIKTTSNTAIVGKTSTPAPKASTGANISGSSKQSLPEVTVSRSRYPEASQHIQDAQASGKPSVLTIDRSGASERRQTSLSGISTQSGFDRDEYPPAMFKEGGFGSSVRYINPRDNRGAGSCIGIQCRDYPDGTQIELKVIDY